MTDRVRLCVKGRFPERFIQRALSEGVRFETVRRTDTRELLVEAATPDARAVCALAERLGLQACVESREGWRWALQAALRRSTLLAGLMLCGALVMLFAAHVWFVDVTALDTPLPPAEEAALRLRLAEMGAWSGAWRSDIDPAFLSARLLSEFDGLTYAGARLRGVRLAVEYQTEDAPPPIYQADEARSLTAARDAVVLSVEALDGRACVKPGDTVRAGQLLISGEERAGADETRAVRAQGHVMGRVWFTARREGALMETVRTRTGGRRQAAALRLFGWRWPLTEAAEFACQDEETDILPIGGLYLPAVVERRTLREARESVVPADRGALEASLSREALDAAAAQLPEGAWESARWTQTREEDGVLVVEATVEAAMDIAK